MLPFTGGFYFIKVKVDGLCSRNANSEYGVSNKFWIEVRSTEVSTIGDLTKKIQLGLGVTQGIGLYCGDGFYLNPELDMAALEDEKIIVRPDHGPVKFAAKPDVSPIEGCKMEEKEIQRDSGNSETLGSGMSAIGEEGNEISKNYKNSEQTEAGNESVQSSGQKPRAPAYASTPQPSAERREVTFGSASCQLTPIVGTGSPSRRNIRRHSPVSPGHGTLENLTEIIYGTPVGPGQDDSMNNEWSSSMHFVEETFDQSVQFLKMVAPTNIFK